MFTSILNVADWDYIPKDFVTKSYPALTAYAARIKALPKIAEYYASRPGQHKLKLTYFQSPAGRTYVWISLS